MDQPRTKLDLLQESRALRAHIAGLRMLLKLQQQQLEKFESRVHSKGSASEAARRLFALKRHRGG